MPAAPTTIGKLLVANRGEIARRVFRTCRDLGIATVAVYSDADADAPFVREADEAVPIGGRRPSESYLRGDAVVAAARRTGADAVHPGYGFLSENAEFAQQCLDARLIWVGPSPPVIAVMASKTEARLLMERAGVPVVPGWHPSDREPVPSEATMAGLRFPVLVKAAFGGGGRGMRVVETPAELSGALAAAQREAASAFGDGAVFVERYVRHARHVEVQILGDAHGNVVHLFERDCSVQRRHQKIVEEAPAPRLAPDTRARLHAAAVDAGKALGYEGAGTVEFIVGPDGELCFLEVNTRLQVEHPVTEMVTGLDLVALQLLVAEGRPLPDELSGATVRGHSIEARLYAENPADGWAPTPGTVRRFAFPTRRGLRVDAGVEAGSEVTVDYDPMLAKVIVHAPSRDEAIRSIVAALRDAEIHGVVTNRDLLLGIFASPAFAAADLHTGFLDEHPPSALLAAVADARTLPVHALAAATVLEKARRATTRALPAVPAGWRNNPSLPRRQALTHGGATLTVERGVGADRSVHVDGNPLDAHVVHADPSGADLVVDGVRRRYRVDVDLEAAAVHVDSPLGSSVFGIVPRFADVDDRGPRGSLDAPMPGTIVSVPVAVGDAVDAGAVVVVLEAMKMEHAVRAPETGVVTEVRVAVGDQVEVGTVLAVVQPAPPATVGSGVDPEPG